MLEVELKFRLDDAAPLIAQLAEMGGQRLSTVLQLDEYFNHPQRNFAETDEAVRIRQTDGTSCITYKGPLIDRETKTRREIEIGLLGSSAGSDMRMMLESLGFRPVMFVRKSRDAWKLEYCDRDIEVAIDQVDGLGQFVELETGCEDGEFAEARVVLQKLAAHFGLQNSERRGYLTLLRESGSASL